MAELGELEAAVMDVVWSSSEPVSVRQVLEQMTPDRRLAYTTVMTVLDKLFKKGWVQRTAEGRAYLYAAIETRATHSARLMRQALELSRDNHATLLNFVEGMTPAEVRELRALLDRPAGRA